MKPKKRFGDYLCKTLLFFSLQVCIMGSLYGSRIWADNTLKIGMLEEPKTLNIWLASDGWSRRVLRRIYHPLYIQDPKNLELIPWLAEEKPAYDEASLSYTIKLRSAKWSDGSELTAEDVVFTGDIIRDFKIPRYYSNWKFVKKAEAIDKRTVRLFLERPKAIFLTRTLTTPIIQKKEWAKVIPRAKRSKKPLSELLNYWVKMPVGTGPFILGKWERGRYLYLKKNKYFFGRGKKIGDHLLGPYIDGVLLKVFGTTDAAVLALRKGTIDMFWWGLQPGYLEELGEDRDIKIFPSEKNSLYYLGFNQRRSPFDDVHFRHAVATVIDRDFIVKRILQGYGNKMDSVVPSVNRFWHCRGLAGYGEGLSRKDRIRKAYKILKDAKYAWEDPPVDASGKVVGGEEIIMPNGEPMGSFSILTPPADYDPHRAMTGIMIQEWLKQLGIPASAKPMGFGALYHRVKALHDFDLFVLGTGELSLDPDYLRNYFHSANDRLRGWNMSGYRNSDFDRIADESSGTLDFEKRRKLIWEMQRILMQDIPYLPLYNPKYIEAARTDKFKGWVQMLGGIGNTWSFSLIRPK